MLTPDERIAIVAEAKEWAGTPYHPNAAVKGQGADCALMPWAVYTAALPRWPKMPVPKYFAQWHMHRGEELYLQYVRDTLGAEPIEEPGPGDFVLFKQGKVYSHGAIVIAWPKVIHSVVGAGVIYDDIAQNARLRSAPRLAFTF